MTNRQDGGETYGKRRLHDQPARRSLNDQAGKATKDAHSHHSHHLSLFHPLRGGRLGRPIQPFCRCRNGVGKIGGASSGCLVGLRFDSSSDAIAVGVDYDVEILVDPVRRRGDVCD
jgi:hypothetical protein